MTRKLSQFWHWLKWIAKSRAVVLGIRHEFEADLASLKASFEQDRFNREELYRRARTAFDVEKVDKALGRIGELENVVKDIPGHRISELEVKLSELERAVVEMQAAHAEEMKELRERLDMPRRKQASGRPFTELRKLAEIGERIMSQKESKSA